MIGALKEMKKGIVDENPVLMQVVAICPALAVTMNVEHGLAMGIATTIVLVFTSLIISLIRKLIPSSVRIPVFIVVSATFVTIVEMVLKGYFRGIHSALGIYLPLITVNCIILSRSESFARKNKPLPSVLDGMGMGLGFTLVLGIMGAIRELFGSGSILGFEISFIPSTGIFILAPGGFLTLAFIMALRNYWTRRAK